MTTESLRHDWREVAFAVGPDLFMCLRCGEMAYDQHSGSCSMGRQIGTGQNRESLAGTEDPPPPQLQP